MVNEQFHEIPLNYGRTDGENLPSMRNDKFFCVGYNQKYGLVDVCEDNGKPFFEGRVNIESLLSEIKLDSQKAVNSQVENSIMEAYNNSMDNQDISNRYAGSSTPSLEILTYES